MTGLYPGGYHDGGCGKPRHDAIVPNPVSARPLTVPSRRLEQPVSQFVFRIGDKEVHRRLSWWRQRADIWKTEAVRKIKDYLELSPGRTGYGSLEISITIIG